MTFPPHLQRLVQNCPAPLRPSLEIWPELEARTQEIWDEVQDAWPDIALSRETFFSYLGERLASDAPLSEVFERLDSSGLYLACACARGDSTAIAAFENLLLPYARSVARRMGLSEGDADDLAATLSEQLLVAASGAPRIEQYSGRGNIRSWLKVSATRLAMRKSHKQRRRRDLQEEDLALGTADSSEDLVLSYLRHQYREPFKIAFRQAFRDLPMDERLLLRRRFVDELTGDELAELYGVHRATIVRRLGRARQALVEGIRASLVQKARVADSEVDSLIRILRSQLDASLSYLLGISSDEC